MFRLRTGAPGSGKTLSLIHSLRHGENFPNSEEKRPVYYYGIPELSPDLGWILLVNPKEWFKEVPDGAIVIIDEVQKIFPARTAGHPVPEGLTVIETHRHRGLDIHFITQHPSLLDVHARRLVNEHFHFKRNFGASFSVCYHSTEIMNDPQDYHALKNADKTTFRYPKDVFKLYKSAEVHTHKFKIPKMLYFGFFCLVVLFYLIYKASSLFGGSDSKKSSTASVSAGTAKSSVLGSSVPLTLESFTPSINNVPASSPAYQSLWHPKSLPIVSSCIGSADNCRCYSQQGTVLSVSVEYCRYVLANGSSYDHTLPDNRVNPSSSVGR